MYQLPLINGDGGPQTFSSEFERMYQLERGQNLMKPLEMLPDDATGSRYTLYDNTDGIYNQEKLFENVDNPNESERVTPMQALERLRNNASINRSLTQSEMRFNLNTTDNFDIRFHNQLMNEATRSGSNIFSEFSQDHVAAVRDSNAALNREINLYGSVPEGSFGTQAFNRFNPREGGNDTRFGTPRANALLSAALAQDRTDRMESQLPRRTQEQNSVPTMSQQFAKMTEPSLNRKG